MALAPPFPKVIDGSTFHCLPDWQQDQLRSMLRDAGVDPNTCAEVELIDEATMRVTEFLRNADGKFYAVSFEGPNGIESELAKQIRIVTRTAT